MIPTVVYCAAAVTLSHAQGLQHVAHMAPGHRVGAPGTQIRDDLPVPDTGPEQTISDSQALYLRTLAVRTARRLGLDHDVAEDCAGQFLVFILQPPRDRQLHEAFAQGSVGWLLRCAENWGLNYRRKVVALRAREVNWSSMQHFTDLDSDSSRQGCEPATREGNPEVELLRSELKERMLAAASQLADGQRCLFFHCLLGHEPALSGRGHRRSDGAMRNALWRLRKRMRRLLIGAGMTPEEAASYLEFLNRPC